MKPLFPNKQAWYEIYLYTLQLNPQDPLSHTILYLYTKLHILIILIMITIYNESKS